MGFQASGGGSGNAFGLYGDGSDGTVTFDGSATVLGLVPAANVYTLNRDLVLANATINPGVTILMANYRILCTGTLTNNGNINANAAPGNPTGAGGAGYISTSGTMSNGTVVNGSAGGATNGTAGFGNSNCPGGGSGKGGDGTSGTGGAAGPTTPPIGFRWLFTSVLAASFNGNATTFIKGVGGGGGGGGGDGTAGAGGGGGGGWVVILSRFIAGAGTIQSRGGNGGTPAAGNRGGGGGGGGGFIVILSASAVGNTIPGQTIDANGGAKGSPSGTGTDNATAGSAGTILIFAG